MTELDLDARLAKFQAAQSAAQPQDIGSGEGDLDARLAAFQKYQASQDKSGSVFDQRGPIQKTVDFVSGIPDWAQRKVNQAKWELTTPEGHAQMTRAFINGIPLAGAVGGMLLTGGLSAPATGMTAALTSALGAAGGHQAGELQKEILEGGVQTQPGKVGQRAGQAGMDFLTQLPFGYRPTGFTPELENYVNKLPASGEIPGSIEDAGTTGLRETNLQPSIYTEKSGLAQYAGDRAFRSSNPGAKDTRIANGKATSPTEVGQDWLDQGILSSSPAKSAAKAGSQVETLGSQLGDAYHGLDNAAKGEGAPGQMPALEVKPFLQRLREQVLDPMKNDPNFDNARSKLETRLNRWDEIYGGQSHFTFSQLKTIKTQLDKTINWGAVHLDQEAPFYNPLAADMRNAIQDNTLSAANDMSAALGNGAKGDEIRALNRQLSSAYLAKDLFTKDAARQFRNRSISPSDYGAVGLGMLAGKEGAGGALLGAAAGTANHLGRLYGNQVLSQGAYWAAKTASLTPAGRAALADWATTLAPQLGRAAMPEDIPQRIWTRVQAIDALEKQKSDAPEPQRKAIQEQQNRLKQRIAMIPGQ